MADLLATDHTVVTYDPHGVGQSTVDDPKLDVTPAVEADDLARLIDAVGGGPAGPGRGGLRAQTSRLRPGTTATFMLCGLMLVRIAVSRSSSPNSELKPTMA